jgi:PBSX family phage terminase large subunit
MSATILPFGRKVYEFGMRKPVDDARITVLEGSVRSGKTWGMHLKMILHLFTYKVGGRRVIVGNSKESVYNNILVDLFDLIGKENWSYNSTTGALMLFGRRWRVVGADDERAVKKIQGMTVGICYIDEATNIPKSFFQMMLSRMSPAGARMYMTCNPDSPYHWLKKEYIDNVKLQAKRGIQSLHFTMDDNPTLPAEFKENLKLQFAGVFYLRYILGLWVIAEGAIYRDVWPKVEVYGVPDQDGAMPIDISTRKPVKLRPPTLDNEGGYESRTIVVDYGTHNPCVFLDVRDTGKRIYVDREYYWDSVEKRRMKTDQEYADDLEQFIIEGGITHGAVKVVVDPSALSFKVELQSRGIWVVDAENEVIEGIRRTSSLINLSVVSVNIACENFIREMTIYAWDDKKAAKGEEEPIKKSDHAPDAFRYYCSTEIPAWRMAILGAAA